MRGQRFITMAAVVAGAVATVPAVPAQAAEAGTPPAVTGRLLELGTLDGFAQLHSVNGPGDIIGHGSSPVGGRVLLWPRRSRTPVDLNTDGGQATALNDRGDVVGPATSDGFYWHDGHLTTLRHPTANAVRPSGINDSGQVVGDLLFDDAPSRVFEWQDGVFTELPTARGASSAAQAVNNRGDVLGEVTGGRAVLWQHRIPQMLPAFVRAVALNNRGQVLANSVPAADGSQVPYLWQNGRLRNLLAGTTHTSGTGVALNDVGDVLITTTDRPFIWHHGRATDIEVAGYAVTASFINERGDVAGTVSGADGVVQGFRWRAGWAVRYQLPAGASDLTVNGIDDRGRIVGGYSTAGPPRQVVFRAAG
jgi:uncharacterized membrane protein